MEWDGDKLTAFMKHFGITGNQIFRATGIPIKTVFNLKYGYYDFEKYNERLTAYLTALKNAKKAEYETLLNYYLNFEP